MGTDNHWPHRAITFPRERRPRPSQGVTGEETDLKVSWLLWEELCGTPGKAKCLPSFSALLGKEKVHEFEMGHGSVEGSRYLRCRLWLNIHKVEKLCLRRCLL